MLYKVTPTNDNLTLPSSVEADKSVTKSLMAYFYKTNDPVLPGLFTKSDTPGLSSTWSDRIFGSKSTSISIPQTHSMKLKPLPPRSKTTQALDTTDHHAGIHGPLPQPSIPPADFSGAPSIPLTPPSMPPASLTPSATLPQPSISPASSVNTTTTTTGTPGATDAHSAFEELRFCILSGDNLGLLVIISPFIAWSIMLIVHFGIYWYNYATLLVLDLQQRKG